MVDTIVDMSTRTGSTAERTQPPAALITNSVLRSPVVRSILHAKIRDHLHNDVVFVGDRAIHVKQVKEEGHLNHITTKSDFDATIRAARVFKLGHGNHEDTLIKTEGPAASTASATLPPHCVVLTLDSNDMLFLYLRLGEDGKYTFIHQTFPMPVFDRVLFQPGQYLAVDHRSRALAVAAHEKEVIIYASKSPDRIRHELQTGDPDWCPVSAQRPIQIDGVIQQMDFLIPRPDDEDHVILLIIVVQARRTKAIRIDWHYTSDIHHAQIHEALSLDQIPSAPGLLIPLRNAGFLLANGSEMMRFDHILSGSIQSQSITMATKEPCSPGDSKRQPMWTNWCRPERGVGAADQLYLAREDGNVFHLYEHGNPGVIASSSNAGNMDCHIGTAFASVGGLDDPDILVTAGDMSSGCVTEIGSRFSPSGPRSMSRIDTMEMRLVETVPNWASMTDLVATTMPGKSQRSRDGVFVTSGRQPFGTISELRYGLEAKLSVIFPLDSLGSVQDVWSIPIPGVGHVLLMLSGPGGTTFVQLESEEAVELLDSTSLDSEHQTIFACFADSKLVQVTTKTVCATTSLSANFEDTSRITKDSNDAIVAATCDPSKSLLITAERASSESDRCTLRSYHFGGTSEAGQGGLTLEVRSSTPISSEALAITCFMQASQTIVLSTNAAGSIDIFSVDAEGMFSAMSSKALPALESSPAMCDSIAVLSADDEVRDSPRQSCLMLCGLRDGRLFTVHATFDGSAVAFTSERTLIFGQSSVRLSRPSEDCTIAYAMSGLETCRLSWTGAEGAPLLIESIWVTDKLQPSLSQGAMTSCTHTPRTHLLSATSRTLADSVVFVAGDEVQIGRIEEGSRAVPRQIETSGTPNRLLYLEQQRCMACASLQYEVRQYSTAPFVRRQVWPVIDFIPSKANAKSFTHDLQPGERVYALLEWSFRQDDEKVYSFLLVGGSYVSNKSGSTRGRITFLQPTNKSWEVVDVKEGRQLKFEEPVYAMALLDPLTFVACYGFRVVVWRFMKDARKWEPMCAPFEMHSAGTSISLESNPDAADGHPLIVVSTNKDSLTVLRFEAVSEADDGYGNKLVLHCTAPRADASLHHLAVDGTTLVSTKDGKVLGLELPQQSGPNNTSFCLTFEADLPRSLTRIRQANIRPHWKAAAPGGVLRADIIGCSADGTLTGLMLVDKAFWHRLSWLQRLCEWSEDLSPHSHQTPPYSVSEETFARNERGMPVGFGASAAAQGSEIVMRTERTKEQDKHIDGDILARVIEHGGIGCLTGMIRAAALRRDAVGEWLKKHIDEELGAASEMVDIVETIVHGWL